MSRRICAGWRSCAPSLHMRPSPSLIRHRPFSFSSTLQQQQPRRKQQPWIQPPQSSSKQQHQGHNRSHHAGTTSARPTVLKAHVYGTLFLSIALLVTDESIDWDRRIELGIDMVQNVTSPPTYAGKKLEFEIVGAGLLSLFSGAGPDTLQLHEGLTATAESQMADQLENWVMTAPDPDVEGGTLILCQSVFVGEDEPDFYVSTHGSMNNDAAEALMPPFEEFAATLKAKGGPVRGALLLLQASGDWKCIYWDGKRWFNLIFLEWQTAESMGFE
ncbi:hypothetical protein PG995_013143 [Apiospora arundinis]